MHSPNSIGLAVCLDTTVQHPTIQQTFNLYVTAYNAFLRRVTYLLR